MRRKEPVPDGATVIVGTVLPTPEDAESLVEKTNWAAEQRGLGFTWNQIATALDMTEGEIQVHVNRQMQQAAMDYDKDKRQHALALFMGRLDYMLTKLIPSIEMGDVKAIDAAIRLTAQQMKLLRLGEDLPETGVLKTLIIRAGEDDEEGYVRQLRAVAGE